MVMRRVSGLCRFHRLRFLIVHFRAEVATCFPRYYRRRPRASCHRCTRRCTRTATSAENFRRRIAKDVPKNAPRNECVRFFVATDALQQPRCIRTVRVVSRRNRIHRETDPCRRVARVAHREGAVAALAAPLSADYVRRVQTAPARTVGQPIPRPLAELAAALYVGVQAQHRVGFRELEDHHLECEAEPLLRARPPVPQTRDLRDPLVGALHAVHQQLARGLQEVCLRGDDAGMVVRALRTKMVVRAVRGPDADRGVDRGRGSAGGGGGGGGCLRGLRLVHRDRLGPGQPAHGAARVAVDVGARVRLSAVGHAQVGGDVVAGPVAEAAPARDVGGLRI
mmetsp:Transcript_27934/g.70645  ORF Transcript_27934/g.70645 Transcript_27934/m.70645 type:complete len:338 (-) Transcript_27934:1578-2591(-)